MGNSLRSAARLLAVGAFATSDDLIYAQFRLMLRLAALAEATAGLRAAQQHAAQATAESAPTVRPRYTYSPTRVRGPTP